ncbi:MAG: hypothetical protein KDA83_03590 [Planctomycetales bacterium]|nr:hypothetical protein [Planctomycetales bacterium]
MALTAPPTEIDTPSPITTAKRRIAHNGLATPTRNPLVVRKNLPPHPIVASRRAVPLRWCFDEAGQGDNIEEWGG